jgi:hypothetical protein
MQTFGASAPLKELQKRFGFEPGRVVATVKELLGRKWGVEFTSPGLKVLFTHLLTRVLC